MLAADNESFRKRLGLEDDSTCFSSLAVPAKLPSPLNCNNQHPSPNPKKMPKSLDHVACPAIQPITLPGAVLETGDTVSNDDVTPCGTPTHQVEQSKATFDRQTTPSGRNSFRPTLDRQTTRKYEEPDPMDDSEVPMNQVLLMDIIPACVILLNAVVTALQQDIMPGSDMWDIVEIPFTVFFILELFGKAYVLGLANYFWGGDWYWSWFDCFCVGLAVFEMFMTYVLAGADVLPGGMMGIFKMLKLARLGRVVRLLRFKIFSELKMMIHGVVTGLRVLIWAVVLLIALVFFLGMTFRVLFGEDSEKFPEFASVPAAMFTAFRCFTEGCASYTGTPLQEKMRQSTSMGGIFMFAYILIFLFITIGVFNLIMAVFIDSVNDGSLKKKQHYLGSTAAKTEYILADLFQTKFIKDVPPNPSSPSSTAHWADPEEVQERLSELAPKFDEFSTYVDTSLRIKEYMSKLNMVINEETFNKWLTKDQSLLGTLNDADIDLSAKFDLFDVLDADLSGELDFVELIEGLMKCRGPVSKNDVIAIRNKVGLLIKMVTQILKHFGIDTEELLDGNGGGEMVPQALQRQLSPNSGMSF